MPAAGHSPNDPARRESHWLLRRADQAAVATISLAALAIFAAYWLQQWNAGRGAIEIDRAEPLVARFQIDVNAAEWPEISQLPEIGETLARRIVEARESGGPYRKLADLRRVKGIGPKTLDKIAPFLLPLGQDKLQVVSQTEPTSGG